MRVVQLSTYDEFGGAGIAATRLHRGLVAAGVDSHILVRQRRSTDGRIRQPGGRWWRPWLRALRRADRFVLPGRGRDAPGFSVGWLGAPVAHAVRALAPDVVHAHWVADGFVRLETLGALPAPVVWTMHDEWAFTGGCHYPGDCARFVDRCGSCPLLAPHREHDRSRTGWLRRERLYARMPMVFVAPSRWMAECARRSALLRTADIRVIPNGIDPAVFAPADRAAARRMLGLTSGRLVLLAGAVQLREDSRKGFAALETAMRELAAGGLSSQVELAIFGAVADPPKDLGGIRVHALGALRGDVAMARAYAAADLFVLPSLEDNLPNTVLEAMASGLPVVAHEVGGLTDLVDSGRTGLLARADGGRALAAALAQALAQPTRWAEWGQAAREKVLQRFTAAGSAAAHQALYEELVANR